VSRRRPRLYGGSQHGVTESHHAAAALTALIGVIQQLRLPEIQTLQLRFGLLDGVSRTLDEVGQALGVSREKARQLESIALSKLRFPGTAHRIREYATDVDFDALPADWRARIMSALGQVQGLPELVWCDKHGWKAPENARRTCGRCPCPIADAPTGRPRKYCSDACRTAGSRAARVRRSTPPGETP
jgi:sigma-70-like protein